MKNITITVSEEVAKWAKVWAARQDASLSRLVGEMLEAKMREESAYDAAKKRYLGAPVSPLKGPQDTYPDRDALYD